MPGFEANKTGRQLALQFLFGVEYYPMDWSLALDPFWEIRPLSLSGDPGDWSAAPGAESPEDESARIFAERLICGVMEHLQDLDDHIATSLDNWKPDRVGRIEWTLLRLAIYELLYCPDTPGMVVMAEAVRLADLFGDHDSARFINGILNRFLQQRSDTGE